MALSIETRAEIETIKREYQSDFVKVMEDGNFCAIIKLMFTYAVISGIQGWGYEDRWCYKTLEEAEKGLNEWDGTGEPQGWFRHPSTGRRRPEGDASKEYVAL